MNIVVGIADCQITRDPRGVLITYALGSCIGVSIYDPLAHVGGLLHFMLPEAPCDANQAARNPWMFADSGIPKLFRDARQQGADPRRLLVRVAGGANVADEKGVFNIGKRNCLAVRRILWKAGVLIAAEETGGSTARTMRLEMSSGRVFLRAADGSPEREL
jgi:chemotaxis protein CheD